MTNQEIDPLLAGLGLAALEGGSFALKSWTFMRDGPIWEIGDTSKLDIAFLLIKTLFYTPMLLPHAKGGVVSTLPCMI